MRLMRQDRWTESVRLLRLPLALLVTLTLVLGGGLVSAAPAHAAGTGPTWSQVSTTGPSARFGASMTYDPATGQLLLFGGLDSSGNAVGDTWAYGPITDSTPPTITISTTATPDSITGWYTRAGSGTSGIGITVSATDASGVTALSCTDNASPVSVTLATPNGDGTPGHPYQGTVTLGDGQHSLACTATDGVGNSGAASDSTTMPVSDQVDQTPPTLTCQPASFVYGQAGATVSAMVTDPTPGSGAVQSPVSSPVSTGSVGNFNISLTGTDIAGNSTTQSCPYSVGQASTTTTLSSNHTPSVVGQAVTFTATVSVTSPSMGTPTGTVTFTDGANPLGTGTLGANGNPPTTATVTTSSLAAGSHSITAVYNGDTNFAGSTSSTLTQLVRYGVTLLYKAPMSGKVSSTVPIKLELTNAAGENLSAASLPVQALCVVVQGATECSKALTGFNWTSGTPQYFTYLASLDKGGGYQFNVKTAAPAMTAGHTYQLLFRAAGEDGSSYHADASATFTLTK